MKKSIIPVIAVCLFLFSCKGDIYRFTNEELNFLPYMLGDKIIAWNNYSSDTMTFEVIGYNLLVTGTAYDLDEFESLEIILEEDNSVIHYNQYKEDNIFGFIIDVYIDQKGVFYPSSNYDHEQNYTYVDNLLIDNLNYKDVYIIQNEEDEENKSTLYLNSQQGFIKIEYDNGNEIYFKSL